jgi:hypothetical protein
LKKSITENKEENKMVRTLVIEKLAYKYEELSESAKERVRMDNGVNDAEFITEDLKYQFEEILKEKYPYFTSPEFIWSLSNCQGDGLSFSADFDLGSYLKVFYPTLANWKKDCILESLDIKINQNSGYYSYASKNCVSYDSYIPTRLPHKQFEKLVDTICSDVEDLYIDICSELEKIGYAEYQNLYSEQYAIEMAEANEWEYDENGRII